MHSLKPLAKTVLPVLLLLLTAVTSSAHPSLESYRWKNRVLILFGPPESPGLQEQRAVLSEDPQGLSERDMVILDPPDTGSLQNHYKVGPQDFTVILVGKDGGEKLRLDRPVTLGELFGLIDQMPMRRREMRQRG